MDQTPLSLRGRAAEDEYFRRRDAEYLQRAQEVGRVTRERIALADALSSSDLDAVDTLHAHGLRASTASMVEWLPAVEVAWLGGVDAAERRAVWSRFAAQEGSASDGAALLERWLQIRPPEALFLTGRRVLTDRLRALDERTRQSTQARILTTCEAAGRASGGVFNLGGLAADERQSIESLRRDLERVS